MSRYNPLAPIPPKRLRQMARAYARAQFGPLLSQINREYGRQARAGQSSITSATQQLAAALGPQAAQTHGIYASAQGQQRSDDASLANYLAAAGHGLQNDVGGQLHAAGQTASTDFNRMGAGSAAAGAGMGSASLSRLVAEGAARENYASGLPAIARLGGLQRARDLELQLEAGRQKDVGALRAHIPSTISQIEQDMANREFQKAAASLSYTGDIKTAQLGAASRNASTRARRASSQESTAVSRQRARETARANRASEAEKRRSDAEKARKDRIAEKQRRRQQWWREHNKKNKGGGPPSANKG